MMSTGFLPKNMQILMSTVVLSLNLTGIRGIPEIHADQTGGRGIWDHTLLGVSSHGKRGVVHHTHDLHQ